MPESRITDRTSPERVSERLVADRKVRAVAQAGSYGTDLAWVGSQPIFITFQRDLLSYHQEVRGGVTIERFPYAKLEEWRDWEKARAEAPLGLLANSRVSYDPTGAYSKIQRTLWNLNSSQLAAYRTDLLNQAEARIKQSRRINTGSNINQQVLTLVEARGIAISLLYPALLTHLHSWPETELRLPYMWRAIAGLRYPKAIYALEELYGFGDEDEARRVLLATRGLGLLEQERRARLAFQAGYYDGVVRFLRDETGKCHDRDLQQWTALTAPRREKLSHLLGVTRSPLGPAALNSTEKLLEAIREGH